MKTKIATVELTRNEITEVIKDWLVKEHKFDLTKAVYDIKGNTINGMVIDVRQRETELPKQEKLASPGKSSKTEPIIGHKKYEKVNTGLYTRLRLFFESEFKSGTKVLKFEDVYELAKGEYSSLTPERLGLYLRDWRQFKRIQYNQRQGEILLLDKDKPQPSKKGTKLLNVIQSRF